MSTTASALIVLNNAVLSGATVGAAGAVVPMNETSANQLVAEGYATRIDAPAFNLATAGYAKNAGVALTLTTTTALTLDLTALAAATGVVVGGDTAFAGVNALTFKNTGATTLVVSPGGSNPLRTMFGGTSPTLTLLPGDSVAYTSVVALVVDSTHKTLTVTPTTGGTMAIGIGGA